MDFYFKVLSENLGLLSVRSQTADSEDQRQVGKREKKQYGNYRRKEDPSRPSHAKRESLNKIFLDVLALKILLGF